MLNRPEIQSSEDCRKKLIGISLLIMIMKRNCEKILNGRKLMEEVLRIVSTNPQRGSGQGIEDYELKVSITI
jgi:hypothetical protein